MGFFLDFIAAEFPWRSPRYRALYPAAGSGADAAYREGIERLATGSPREVGFPARSRTERMAAGAPGAPAPAIARVVRAAGASDRRAALPGGAGSMAAHAHEPFCSMRGRNFS